MHVDDNIQQERDDAAAQQEARLYVCVCVCVCAVVRACVHVCGVGGWEGECAPPRAYQ